MRIISDKCTTSDDDNAGDTGNKLRRDTAHTHSYTRTPFVPDSIFVNVRARMRTRARVHKSRYLGGAVRTVAGRHKRVAGGGTQKCSRRRFCVWVRSTRASKVE